MARQNSWISQLIAGICLLTLLGTWAPHAHYGSHPRIGDKSSLVASSAGRANTPNTSHSRVATTELDDDDDNDNDNDDNAEEFSLSPDDAHSEHSSRAEIAETTCPFCRSNSEHEDTRPSRAERIFESTRRVAFNFPSTEQLTSSPLTRLRAARAPPLPPSG